MHEKGLVGAFVVYMRVVVAGVAVKTGRPAAVHYSCPACFLCFSSCIRIQIRAESKIKKTSVFLACGTILSHEHPDDSTSVGTDDHSGFPQKPPPYPRFPWRKRHLIRPGQEFPWCNDLGPLGPERSAAVLGWLSAPYRHHLSRSVSFPYNLHVLGTERCF